MASDDDTLQACGQLKQEAIDDLPAVGSVTYPNTVGHRAKTGGP
jgi:hypothetical protein